MPCFAAHEHARGDQAQGPRRGGDGQHLERGELEDDEPGRDWRYQSDRGHEIVGKRGRLERSAIQPGACTFEPRTRRPGLELALSSGQHLRIVGKRPGRDPRSRRALFHLIGMSHEVIIGRLVSLFGQRLLATIVALWVVSIPGSPVVVAALPDSTWVALAPLPNQPRSALFALAIDPFSSQLVIAGDARGALFRSTNGGATWTPVHSGRSSISTIAFSLSAQGVVLAGTRGSGALVSRDSGATWTTPRGIDGRTVHAFAFALTFVAAGTDHGVYVSADGLSWAQSGLANRNINAIAVAAIRHRRGAACLFTRASTVEPSGNRSARRSAARSPSGSHRGRSLRPAT